MCPACGTYSSSSFGSRLKSSMRARNKLEERDLIRVGLALTCIFSSFLPWAHVHAAGTEFLTFDITISKSLVDLLQANNASILLSALVFLIGAVICFLDARGAPLTIIGLLGATFTIPDFMLTLSPVPPGTPGYSVWVFIGIGAMVAWICAGLLVMLMLLRRKEPEVIFSKGVDQSELQRSKQFWDPRRQ